jgi:hypothetical protein
MQLEHQARHGAQLQRSSALLPWISPVHEGGERGLCAIYQGAADCSGANKSVFLVGGLEHFYFP